MSFSISHRAILGHVFNTDKIANLQRKGTKFIFWMCLKLTWRIQIYFKENSVEEYLKCSHWKEISDARQSNFYN